jgi:WD40 repeat protein
MGDYAPSRVDQKLHAHEKEATCVAFNNSGNLLATGGADSLLKIWDINRYCEVTPIKVFSKPLSAIAFAKD